MNCYNLASHVYRKQGTSSNLKEIEMDIKLIISVILLLTMNIGGLYIDRNSKGCLVTLMKAWSIFTIICAIVFVVLIVVYGWD